MDKKGDELSQLSRDRGGSQDMGLSALLLGKFWANWGKVIVVTCHCYFPSVSLTVLIRKMVLMASICKSGGWGLLLLRWEGGEGLGRGAALFRLEI